MKFEDLSKIQQLKVLAWAKERGFKHLFLRQGLVDCQPVVEMTNKPGEIQETVALSEIIDIAAGDDELSASSS